MIALADHSNLPVWGVKGWVILLAAVVFVAIATRFAADRAVRRSPSGEPEVSGWDVLDGAPRCHLRCGLPGTITRVTRADLGLETVRVCPGHSDEGDHPARGWWVA